MKLVGVVTVDYICQIPAFLFKDIKKIITKHTSLLHNRSHEIMVVKKRSCVDIEGKEIGRSWLTYFYMHMALSASF